MMRIYLPEVKSKNGEPVDYSFEDSIPDHYEADWPGDGSLKLKVTAFGSGDTVLISGNLDAVVDACCVRCLQPFMHRFTADFQESFTVRAELPEHDDPALSAAEAANELTVAGDYLYLDEYIRQVFIMAQQYNPLCRSDCLGICQGCGVNLNDTACRCKEEHPVDIRLMKLKDFDSRG